MKAIPRSLSLSKGVGYSFQQPEEEVMPYVYFLQCANGNYYTGSTWNLEKRLWEHQSGLGANYTKKHLPVKLIYCEEFERVEDAYLREKQIQGWSRRKKEALMAGDMNKLLEYSRSAKTSAAFSPHSSRPSTSSGSEECGENALTLSVIGSMGKKSI